jgi:hypothetical protein
MEKQFEVKNEGHIIARMMELIKELDVLYDDHVGRTPNWVIEDFAKNSNITGKEIPKEVVARAGKLLDELKTLRETWKKDSPFQNFDVRVHSDNGDIIVRDKTEGKSKFYFNNRLIDIDTFFKYDNGVALGLKEGKLVFVDANHDITTKYTSGDSIPQFVVNRELKHAVFAAKKENGKFVAVDNGIEVGPEFDRGVQMLQITPREGGVDLSYVGYNNSTNPSEGIETASVVVNGHVVPQTFSQVQKHSIMNFGDIEALFVEDHPYKKSESDLGGNKTVKHFFKIARGSSYSFEPTTLSHLESRM